MTQITNKTVRFNFMLHSPSEEASSATLAPLSLVSGLLFLEITVVRISQICCSMFFCLASSLHLLRIQACRTSLQAKQEVFFPLIGWIPAVCGSVLSAGRPCGNTREWQSGRGRMQADLSPFCQLLVLRYQPISRGPGVLTLAWRETVAAFLNPYMLNCVYSTVSGMIWKINWVSPLWAVYKWGIASGEHQYIDISYKDINSILFIFDSRYEVLP